MNDLLRQSKGAWIFVSHSTKDIFPVRSVRNALEEMGHNPILFFLKSVSEHSELDGLIRREIEARNWFVLCDSENAKTSRWVQQEREMIKNLPGKVYRTIDLNRPLEPQMDILRELSEAATVFISYRRSVSSIAKKVYERLDDAGFRVWMDIANLNPGEDFSAAIKRQIDDALDNGWVLLLLDSTYFGGKFTGSDICRLEATYALQRNTQLGKSRVIPILVDDPNVVLANAPSDFLEIKCVDIHTDFELGIKTLIQAMFA